MSEFADLDKVLTDLLTQLSAGQRARAMREVGVALRRSNAERIAANVSPDGVAFEPRKKQLKIKGALKRKKTGAMFRKLKLQRYLSSTATPDGAEVSFKGGAEHIAQVHHYGLVDKVRDGLTVLYPARQLLGINEADRDLVRDILSRHLKL